MLIFCCQPARYTQLPLCSSKPGRSPQNAHHLLQFPSQRSVAEASAATLAEMNPYVKVSVLPGTPVAALAPENLRQADLLLLCGQDASVIAQADALCREDGVAFFAGVCRGMFGWAFADLGEHTYVWEVRRAVGVRWCHSCTRSGWLECKCSWLPVCPCHP